LPSNHQQGLSNLFPDGKLHIRSREILQEQHQEMERGQTRIQQLALKENQDTGIFGWLWKQIGFTLLSFFLDF
jgi:hypothetical protein